MNNSIRNHYGHQTVDHALTSHVLTPVNPVALSKETISVSYTHLPLPTSDLV